MTSHKEASVISFTDDHMSKPQIYDRMITLE